MQRTQDGAVDENPAAQRQNQGDGQHHDGHGAGNVVIRFRLRDELVGARVGELQHVVHGLAERGVGSPACVVQVQVVLDGQILQRGGLAAVNVIELLVGGVQLGHDLFGTRHARRLAEGVEQLQAIGHERVGALGLRGRLFGLALLHVHQRIGKQQASAQERAVGALQLRRLVGIGFVDLCQLVAAGVQPHPRHPVRNEHGAREEQQHQNDTSANFQISKHEISER
ncbi:hypothetical protein LMG26686_05385 [Achromobacter mucicolens]|nr:hypothetical protein LMG26686_05385 [Achromobacter mucicolens]